MILVNVLMFVAIASSVVMLMISGEDAALHRAVRMREAERAQAIAHGGELSAIAALRRDAQTAPAADHRGEAWGQVMESAAPIEGGSFDLAISDAQGRFNVNMLKTGDADAVFILRRIAAALRIPDETATRAIELVRLYGPFNDLQPLAGAGLEPETMRQLTGLVTALPYRTPINVNSASEPMLAILLANPTQARLLAVLRERQGFLLQSDFENLGTPVPAGAGFTSNLFWVRTRVTIGGTSQQLTSLVARRRDEAQRLTVAAIGRWRGNAIPLELLGETR